MYNTSIICTYKSKDVFCESDDINDVEKDFIRNAIYRQELLNILDLDDFSEIEINKAIDKLHEKIKTCTVLIECATLLAANFLSTDIQLGFIILFSFDYMDLTHKCICEYLENGNISNENIIMLKNEIQSNK